MKHIIKTSAIVLILFFTVGLLTNFNVDKNNHNSNSPDDSIPQLLSIANLGDCYYTDNGYDINTLSEHTNNQEKKIKSISVYRFSTTAQNMILQDSILLNREGKPVVRMTPYNAKFSTTYYFYDDKGNGFLDITILDNKYDTLYALRKFDNFNHEYISIEYNITRKQLTNLASTDILPGSDSAVRLKRVIFETDINHNSLLPNNCFDILLKQVNDSLVNMNRNSIFYRDSSYNSTEKSLLQIKNNWLVDKNVQNLYTYDPQGNWIEKKNEECDILQRSFSYYGTDNNEIPGNFTINNSVLKFLYSQMDSLPLQAWKNYTENQNSLKARTQMIADGTYGDSITLKERNTIDAFLPALWYQVSVCSGYIAGIDNICYVVGYNTPIEGQNYYDGDNNYKRCLAIYEHRNGKFRLLKQSFGAIEEFYDEDNDLLFDGYTEKNFSVDIQDGDIFVNYEYMRGEALYAFAFEKGNWIMVKWAGTHRTCCQIESSSYDYRTKTYSSSIENLGDEDDESGDMPRDTSYSEVIDKPIIYMDDVYLKEYGF